MLKNLLKELSYKLLKMLGGPHFGNRQYRVRRLFWHLILQKLLRINAHVPWPVHPSTVVIGVENIVPGDRNPGISTGCYLQGNNGIVFGENVWVGPGVGIISANHDLSDYHRHQSSEPIRIGNNCWIGMNAVILPGVQLGDHVVVGAGAIVTKSFEDNCLIAGNPASILRQLQPYQTASNQ